MLNENLNYFKKINIINAEYSEQLLPEYQGNPLIESLPPILTEEEFIQYSTVFPAYNNKECELDNSYRFHCIQRLFQYFQPFEVHIDLEQRISRAIRQGYITRNPFNVKQVKQMNDSYKALKLGLFLENYEGPMTRTATGFTIIGFSGIGKTTAIEKVLSLYPQCILHKNFRGEIFHFLQISWLKLDCPFDGSIKGLCMSFFSEIDRLIGTNYFSKLKSRNNSIDVLLQYMIHLANLHAIGLIIIDEIQHLNLSKSGGSEKMLNFFVTLVNTIGIPVIMVGTNKAIRILQSQFRQARRGSGQGDMVWNQMPKNEMWDLFIEGMWDYQWTKEFTPLTNNINSILYEESQGIIDIAKKLFMITQLQAISADIEKITPSLIEKVAKENLKLVKPMLKALKSGIPSEIAKYDDIQPIDMEEQIVKFKASIDVHEKIRLQKKLQENKRNIQQKSFLEEIMLFLLSFEVDPKKAEVLAAKILNNHSEDESFSLVDVKKEAMRLLFSEENKKKNNTKVKNSASNKEIKENILCYLADRAKKNKKSVYEELLQSGYIKGKIDYTGEIDDINISNTLSR
ncbi:ATP-binding protein [Gottfriedia acidiceleris]|uniref:ATP-binding protein n=1 Tax=Gottfriedia acidiceleris TaxID=371036 RepID=A0ABY4JMV1_9BACI|nr:ATP-binding protein [Gottfriedia acidiceleris]UPM54534.1 ATP-binding protein [Gottfriedia acidiceleris]